jgi:hypothetical protein
MPDPSAYLVIDGRSHADLESLAYHCGTCGKTYCGSCCLPRWEAMKKIKGLTGSALAKAMNDDPDACFSELPRCPQCRGSVDEVATTGQTEASQSRTEGENYDRSQAIMSARVCGPLLLLPLAYCLIAGKKIEFEWGGALCVLAGAAMVIWGYSSKLPKSK